MVLLVLTAALGAQSGAALLSNYTRGAVPFPRIYQPYRPQHIAGPDLANSPSAALPVRDGKLLLSIDEVIAAVLRNNTAVAAARYYPAIADTELLRARSGASPRGVDVSRIPGGVFAGSIGGSILGTAGGGSSGSSNPGGITGAAGRVSVRPAGIFDPAVSVAFSLDRTASPLNTEVVAGVPSVTTSTLAVSANYVWAFSTGTSFTVSYGLQRQSSTQLRLLFNPDFTPGFTATVSQQLLNGFGFAVNRALIKVAENERRIERESFRQQVITALVSAQDAYWDLAAAQAGVRAAERAREAAHELVEENQAQYRAGTMSSLDVYSAQAQEAAAQRDLVAVQTAVQTAEWNLKGMITRRIEEPLASASIEIQDSFPDPSAATIPTQEEAIAAARANRPELSIAAGNIKSEEDAMPFIHNALLPNFNVFALVTTVGLYDVFGTSFTEAIHFRYPEYAFGVTISFPVRNRQAQADEVRSRLEVRQSKDMLVRTESQVEVDVENALIGLRNAKAQVGAAEAARRLAIQKADAERKKLTAGLSTSYNVVLADRDVLSADLAYVQARDTFAKARVALDQTMGTTLDACHISLDDALHER